MAPNYPYYAVYRYELSKADAIQGDFTQGETLVEPQLEHRYDNFEHLFGDKGAEMRIQHEKKRGTGADKYPCYVLAHDNHIVLLRLENVKTKTVYEEQHTGGPIPRIEVRQYDSYPPVNILIDNRENRHQLLIEIDSAAWSKTTTVRDLLMENLNRELCAKFGLQIKITSLMRSSEYWDYVTYRQREENRGIKKLVFRFPNARIRPSIEAAVGLSQHLKSLMSLINSLGGGQGELALQAPTDNYLLRRRLTDIKKMVALCASSEYALSVTFDDDVTYKCNEDLRAELPLDRPHALDDFEHGQKNALFEYEIEDWLDSVMERCKGYQNAEQVSNKPNRNAQRKVS